MAEPLGRSEFGAQPAVAPAAGTVIEVRATPGTVVAADAVLVVLEAMKMEFEVRAESAGAVREVLVAVGDAVHPGDVLLTLIGMNNVVTREPEEAAHQDLAALRPDLAAVLRRHAVGLDQSRPDAVARRHAIGRRTARENLADLCDPGSFREYGALTIAAQRQRRSVEDLELNTPADGLVAGFATVNSEIVGADRAQTAVLAYDYTVLAGTQGIQSHKKSERMFELARRRRTPVVIFAEGGGGRPGDTDNQAKATGMDLGTFVALGRLNGVVATVAVVSGRCFAGNAAIVGCCDVIIATPDANLGMGGPAMIEGGGLGVVRTEEIGPMAVQVPNGVVDVLVADERQAVDAARRYLSFFQGPIPSWTCGDQRELRFLVPEARKRSFDIRRVVRTLIDEDSYLELRENFGRSMVTVLGRLAGHPLGIVANDGRYLGGAIDSDAADKMARFMQLCDAHGLPILTLCDTPGFMVGPESEETGAVRHFGRLFVAAAGLSVPLCTVIVRKSYGLGGQAMAGGSFRVPGAMLAWPTGELGAMGPEGAVRLGYRQELDALQDPYARQAEYERLLTEYVATGQATTAASVFELDDVIDPAETRAWVQSALVRPEDTPRQTKRIDTW